MWAETLNSKYKLHKKERKSWFYDVRRTWDVESLGLDLRSTMCLNSIYLSATRRIYQALGGSTEILHVEFLFLSVIISSENSISNGYKIPNSKMFFAV